MKRVLLIRTYRDVGAGGAVPPSGLLYVASALRKAFPGDCEIKFLDTAFESDPAAAVTAAARDFSPDLAGFSVLSCEAGFALSLAAAVKKARPSVFTVFGGPYASVSPEEALAGGSVDACVIGEGEITAVELLSAVSSGRGAAGLPGVAARLDGKVVSGPPRPFIEDLDSLELPAWDLVDFGKYSRLPNWNGYLKKELYAPLLTSRGCPFHCVYCHNLFGRKVRARSARLAADEVLFLREKYGVEEFHITDDVFNFDRARALEFAALVAERAPGLAFSFPNGLRADLTDAGLMQALKGMGTYKIHFGVESASARVREYIKKDLSLDKVSAAVELADREGITTAGYFMLGFPGETGAEMKETADYAASSNFDAAYFFKATPYRGTELYNSLPAESRPSGENGFFSAGPAVSARDAEVNAAILYAQRKFYLSPRRLWRLLRKSHNTAGFLRTLPKFLAELLLISITAALGPPQRKP